MDVYFIQQIDNSRVIRVADPRRRREQHVYVGAVVMLFLLLFGYAWQRYAMVELGYKIEAARQQQAQLESWNEGLELQRASLGSPERIYSLAQARLGMQNAQPGQVLALDVAPLAGASTTRSAMLTTNP
ncbi:MAG TPA: cell division protein FtsL [Terriglobales bacterium]|nr:cell division protein FtsL [Terriglobales bacterium]